MKELELTYLEFYSGIGGWSYALQEAISILQNPNIKLSLRRLAAFDHSDLCNHVLNYNNNSTTSSNSWSTKKQVKIEDSADNLQSNNEAKKHQPMKKRKLLQSSVSIEKLTKKSLQAYHATVWVMSPPCQPHTRQHSNQEKDINDPRSKSFLHLCDMISCLGSEYLPRIILLENVLGFEQVSGGFL
jgi:tRNA (cytosine38-C5)-methyltransferase